MRTYTRKRPEYQAIEGVTELCRLCLGSSEVSVPIFGEDADQLCATLSLRIMICVGLEMTRDNYLPNAICVACYKELERYYTFRKKCEVTYQKLKAHVLAMKERHYNNLMGMKTVVEEVNDDKATEQPVEAHQQLVLTFDENQQIQLVNLVNSNSIQLGTSENLFTQNTLQELSNEIDKPKEDQPHIENEAVNESSTSPIEIANSPDLSLIMSTMLVQLGVLRQEADSLVLVDADLKTVELEGADNSTIVLHLTEEDEVEQDAIVEVEREQTQDDTTMTSLIKSNVQKKPDIEGQKDSKTDRSCGVCHKRFSSRSAARRHALVHSGARPHVCAVCARSFAQRAVLARHQLVHSEKRPFACTACPKSFTQRAALLQHARQHAPPHARALALHTCPVCRKVFLYASGLSRHAATHTGKRYTCEFCPRSFADHSSMRRHAARHAPRAPAQH